MTIKEKRTLKSDFHSNLSKFIKQLDKLVATEDGEWVVKGFIDVSKNIYTITNDTKVVSKILELFLIPKMKEYAKIFGYEFVLSKEQNSYPDISFLDKRGNKFAVDIKTTYRRNSDEVNGMTLGAFTGYFRNRDLKKNITFPYKDYLAHFVLGVIYSRSTKKPEEDRIYTLTNFQKIVSVIKSFDFFVQEKYKIAIDRPGSGNTKNIGSINKIALLLHGKGPFAGLGEDTFDDYWRNYLTNDMSPAAGYEKPPYRNLKEYLVYKKQK